jgi:NhaP-type Na+/H+ or K+/H+ antiporter
MNNTFKFLFAFLAYLGLAASQVYAHPVSPVMASSTGGKRAIDVFETFQASPIHFMIGVGTGVAVTCIIGVVVWYLIRRAKKKGAAEG